MIRLRFGARTWIVLAAAVTFAVHAACYLYFFVDDEAIPLVYARHLLEGRGLVYTALEGRVEGYSDFLHVLFDAALLAAVRIAHLDAIAVLDIGTWVSVALGFVVLLATARLLTRAGTSEPALLAGLAFLALAGPLAVWSCSSLETVPFACALTLLTAMIMPGAGPIRRSTAALLAGVVLLERLDGFVYLGAILLAALVFSPPRRQRELLYAVAMPALLIAAVYQAARLEYFGTLVSAPLAAKVLYKVSGGASLIRKQPNHLYLTGFLRMYGIVLVPAAAGAALAARSSSMTRMALLAIAFLAGYAQAVGDWMFGWRFIVPTLPLIAIAIAAAVDWTPPRLRWPCAAAFVTASSISAYAFGAFYVSSEQKPIWWTSPHLGRAVWLAPYADLIDLVGRSVSRGEVIAYNQAGLVPFVLDADNIDDLGICSRFEADLPTTDVFYTEVGRYTPLTDAPVFSAAHAYLLYRDVRLLVSRTDLLTNANHGHVPPELLGGFFRLSGVDRSGANAVYVRSERDASAYRREPSVFWENLAHTSRLRRVEIDGHRVPDDAVGSALRFLRWDTGTFDVPKDMRIDIRFAERDEDVYAVYAGALAARGAAALSFTLYDEKGRAVAAEHAQADGEAAPLLHRYSDPVRARLLSIEIRPAGSGARVSLSDVRVMGQSAALRDFVRRRLPFPAP